jgi:RND superfamily putative drug exporter
VPSLVSLFGSWNWYLPDGVARVLRVPASHRHAELRPQPVAEPVGSSSVT